MSISAVGNSQNAIAAVRDTNTYRGRDTSPVVPGGAVSIWDVLEKLAKLKQDAINKADDIAKTMSADDDEATKAQKQRELAKATAFIEDVQKKIEKMTETAHTTSSSRL